MKTTSALSKWLIATIFIVTFSFSGFAQEEPLQEPVVYVMVDTAEANRLLEEAKLLITERKTEEAFPLIEKSKAIYTALLNENSLEVANVIYQEGRYFYYQQNYDQAIEKFNESLAINKIIYGLIHTRVARHYSFIGICNELRANFDEAIKYHNLTLQLEIKLYGENHIEVADSYQNLGNTYLGLGKYNDAILNYDKALQIRTSLFGDDHPHVPQTYLNLAITYNYKGDFKRAKECGEKALSLYEQQMGESFAHPFIAGLFNNIGTLLESQSDYDKAIDYYSKSILMYSKLGEEKYPESSNPYSNIAAAYHKKGETEKAIRNAEKALQLRTQAFGEEHPEVANALNNLSAFNSDNGDKKTAIELLYKSLAIYEKSQSTDHPYIADINANLAVIYLEMNELEKADQLINKALDLNLTLKDINHPDIARTYISIFKIQSKRKQFLKADSICNVALHSLNFTDEKHLSSVSSLSKLWDILQVKISNQMNLFRKYNDAKYLYGSKQNFNIAISVLDYYSKQISPSSKNSLANDYNIAYQYGTQTNLLLYQLTDSIQYLTQSFSFAERSKSFLLYEAIQESNALKVAGIPDTLLTKEYDLRIDIAYFDKVRQEKINEGLIETDTAVLEIAEELFGLKQDYESLKNHLETYYPKYYKAKYDLSSISLKEVQTNILQPNQSLLEYMVVDSSIFIFLVQKDTFEIHEVKNNFQLNDLIRRMTKDGIYGYHSIPQNKRTSDLEESTISNYTNAAQQLYKKLIAPVAGKLTEDLIIIPDGVLGYVPFEALLTATPKREGAFKTYPYLLKKHQISYCYSATLLQEMQQKQHRQKTSNQLLAMAPFFQDDVEEIISKLDTTDLLASVSLRDSLGALKGSGEEIARINKLWKGTSVYGTDATLEAFQQKAADYQILHLSTHGKADDRVGDYAYLAFGVPGVKGTFDKLYARDLYNYSLNADMVVLSACETGIGKLQKGEGIVSLARAFAYAGAKSIFSTLWKVDDVKTKDLMVYFYANLKKGETKDEALRNAKLKYLEKNNKNGEAMHPFFWAGMIGIGDMSVIPFDD
jgi:CHAT domain-containing protein/Tfp pilus assembly protein PilF